MAGHWWEGRPWTCSSWRRPRSCLSPSVAAAIRGQTSPAPADLATWRWAAQGGVPCPPHGRKVLAGGAGGRRWRRNGRATQAGPSRGAPGRGARCVPGSWLSVPCPARPPPPGSRTVRMLPRHCRQTSPTTSVQSSLGSLLPACSPCAAREWGFSVERGLGPHSPCVGGSTAAQPPGRQVWAVTLGPGPLSCRACGPWPLARGADGRPALQARAARPPSVGIRARCCVL